MLIVAGLAALALPSVAAADEESLTQCAPITLPQGITVDSRGHGYFACASSGELRRFDRTGKESTLATLPVGNGVLLGLAIGRHGDLYAALASFGSDTHGIWRIRRDGSSQRLVALRPDGLPNDLAFGRRGDLFVSDAFLGGVWRVPTRNAGDPQLVRDALLGGNQTAPLPIGASGLAFDRKRRTLFVGNTDLGSIVRLPIGRDGRMGTPQPFIADDTLKGIGRLALDKKGVLAEIDGGASLIRATWKGTLEPVSIPTRNGGGGRAR